MDHPEDGFPALIPAQPLHVHIVCVGLSESSVPASMVSILALTVSASAESLNCTPMPAARLPCEPGGVIQTTLPATGRRSLSSGSDSSRKTSSPSDTAVGRNENPAALQEWHVGPVQLPLSLMASERMPCLAPAPPIIVLLSRFRPHRLSTLLEHVTPFVQQSRQHQVVSKRRAQLLAGRLSASNQRRILDRSAGAFRPAAAALLPGPSSARARPPTPRRNGAAIRRSRRPTNAGPHRPDRPVRRRPHSAWSSPPGAAADRRSQPVGGQSRMAARGRQRERNIGVGGALRTQPRLRDRAWRKPEFEALAAAADGGRQAAGP